MLVTTRWGNLFNSFHKVDAFNDFLFFFHKKKILLSLAGIHNGGMDFPAFFFFYQNVVGCIWHGGHTPPPTPLNT